VLLNTIQAAPGTINGASGSINRARAGVDPDVSTVDAASETWSPKKWRAKINKPAP
jgi:hypothetical protein